VIYIHVHTYYYIILVCDKNIKTIIFIMHNIFGQYKMCEIRTELCYLVHVYILKTVGFHKTFSLSMQVTLINLSHLCQLTLLKYNNHGIQNV